MRSFVDEKPVFFACKRLSDIIISALFIVFVLSWLFPIIALLIWLDSNGPVMFLQERVGRGGKTFICFKFRTMVPGPGGLRITALGNFLRKSNIDEFPQFLNVLLGSMSIVGPRPHTHADCRRFSAVVDRYKFRSFVRPGITGLAQIKGYHGPAIREESITGRYEWDAFYVRNASFWLDISIIRHTAVQSLANLAKLFYSPREVPRPSSN
ncbi:MAG TPA: sugar transferase [Chitinophagaceae bacterium]|nr:sugar transferase [Chitinophagaceae bacterium]